MGRFVIVLAVLLAPMTAVAQHRVTFDPQEIDKHGLPESLASTYMVFTFVEYKKLRLDMTKLTTISKKLRLMVEKAKVLDTELKATGRKAVTLSKDLDSCLKSRKRVTKKWSTCDLKNRMCRAGSWKPWAITAAAIAVAIVGISFGGYYGWKYSKVK